MVMAGGKEVVKAREAFEIGARHQVEHDNIKLGPLTSYSLAMDPKHMAFVLARYKFVARMLDGMYKVVEVGCGDGFGIPIVAQAVSHLYCIDWEPALIESINKELITPGWVTNTAVDTCDINVQDVPYKGCDAIYTIDVIEHIDPENETIVMERMCGAIHNYGVMIMGTPNKDAGRLSSWVSEVAHINMKSYDTLKELMSKYFYNVFMFGMNDEVVHTGHPGMCHYLWSIGSCKR